MTRSLLHTGSAALIGAAVAAFLVLVVTRNGLSPVPTSDPNPPTIRIEFVVTDAQTGHPIDATIYLNDQKVGTGHELHVLVRAEDEQAIRAEAPGYRPYFVNMRPHNIDSDKRLTAPIKMWRARPGT